MIAPAPAPMTPDARRWWSDRRYLALLVALSAAPLLWPSLPPLTDALGHLARYHVELAIDTSPYLKQFFAFRWALLGNLGVDLLVIPLAPIFGLQLTVKLIAMLIPVLTAAGLILVAREAHGGPKAGGVPPTIGFALPLAYGFPFQFGFLNYTLSMALALLAFALWLRLGRAGRYRLRSGLFLAIAPLIWLCHVYGWGVLGLLCFSAELVRDRGQGRQPLACDLARAARDAAAGAAADPDGAVAQRRGGGADRRLVQLHLQAQLFHPGAARQLEAVRSRQRGAAVDRDPAAGDDAVAALPADAADRRD